MTTLKQNLDGLAPTAAVRTFATELAARTAVESAGADGYVSLRPSMSGAIAVYAHRTKVSIAVDPDQAAEVAHKFPAARLEKKGPTTYLHLTDDLLAKHSTAAVDLAVEAVAWKAAGPTSTLGGHAKKPEKETKSCPKHWMELTPSGACPVCG